jgi:uncharacterized protein HemX
MNFDDISRTLLIAAAGVGIGYYIWVVRPKNQEITNPDEIDREQRLALIERELLKQEQRQLMQRNQLSGGF